MMKQQFLPSTSTRHRALAALLAVCALTSLGQAQTDTPPPVNPGIEIAPPLDAGTTTTTPPTDTTTGGTTTSGGTTATPPADTTTTPPAEIVPTITTSHADAIFTVVGGTATSTYQWRLNGTALEGKTSSTLTVTNVAPANTGVYSVDIIDGTTTKTATTVLGLATTNKIAGDAIEVGADIQHTNGNVYDQLLLTGPAATVTADAGQVTRLSFVDINDDIVQVEFSGAGSLSINLENASAPAPAVKYNQPGVNYVKGHPTIVISGADETTNVSVFSVGRITAVNQALFRNDLGYDGHANLAALVVLSTDGKFGGIRAGNTDFLATKGITGIYAPAVNFTGPVVVGEITADAAAEPVLQLGASTKVTVAGGDLFQMNNAPVQVSGFATLFLKDGLTSHGTLLSAKTIAGKLMEGTVDVTDRAQRD